MHEATHNFMHPVSDTCSSITPLLDDLISQQGIPLAGSATSHSIWNYYALCSEIPSFISAISGSVNKLKSNPD